LIYQLLQLLPPGTSLNEWSSAELVGALDGSIKSLPQAFVLFEALVKKIPASVCIIDCLQHLAHSQDETINSGFASLLNTFPQHEICSPRILLTSSGPNPLLATLDEKFLSRSDVSKTAGSGRFVLSAELMGVSWM